MATDRFMLGFPLMTLSHLDPRCLSPFLTLGDWSSFHCFVLGFEVSSSHHQINMKFYSCLQSWIVRWFDVSNILVNREPIQSDAEQNPAILTCLNPPRPFPLAFHLLPVELGPILYRSPERRHSVSVYRIDLIDLVQLLKLRWLIDHVGNMPPS